MSKKERMPTGAEAPDTQRERLVETLSEECAERAENARRQKLLEFLIRMEKEADRNDAPILAATAARLDELEAEDALRSGTLFTDADDDSVN